MYDEETCFYYLRTRYYDPYIGRFLNADGLVSTGTGLDGYNMFAYCGGNPINRADPNGQFWKTIIRCAKNIWSKLLDFYYSLFVVEYEVLELDQGDTNLCWAYCQGMIMSARMDFPIDQTEGDLYAEHLAKEQHGPVDWDKAGSPEKMIKLEINTAEDIRSALVKYGPLYVSYDCEEQIYGHAVVLYKIDWFRYGEPRFYTMNPNGLFGVGQFLEEFLSGPTGVELTGNVWILEGIYYLP